ncbi:MAG: Dam family site-specific DNA-(adenine-N6)-methyltransferase [Verrucomicrobiota bacterium JB023]|nr:Dam family site-specific DNA-(adenine-N6)-methyltransferase [Verrucomicrobiota bacterium JB023]
MKPVANSSAPPPPLKWAGGKRWLVPRLRELWQPFAQQPLIEPFCGGLAVALGLQPRHAILNDANPHLINFYQQVRKGLKLTIEAENDSSIYYEYRDNFNELIGGEKEKTKKAAQLFYYLNRTGFNGLCRFNRSGLFNVPFGRYRKINYREDFFDYQELFANWSFSCGDFERLSLPAGSLIYADPPYDVEFTQYSAGGFDWNDQIRLAEWLSSHEGPVILSNQMTPRIRELYGDLGFRMESLEAPRRISCNGDRQPAREVLATLNF